MVATAVAAAALCAPAAASAGSAPLLTGSVSNTGTLSGATAVAVAGHYAFVAAAHNGELTAVDFTDPSRPYVAGSTGPTVSMTNASNLAVLGNYAYVTSKNRNTGTSRITGTNDDGSGNSLTIVDLTNPAAPTVAGTPLHDSTNLFGAYGIAVAQRGTSTYAYVAAQGVLANQPTAPDTSTGAFDIIDVTNPIAPSIKATLQNSPAGPWPNALQHITSVAIHGNYAYVTASYDNRLTVIDISSPTTPKIVASLQDNTELNSDVDVAIQGNYAYVANQGSGSGNGFPGLSVVDISNPLAPRIVGADGSSFLFSAYRVKVRGTMAYASTYLASNAVAVDIADPLSPHLAAGIHDPAHLYATTGVDVDPSLRYLAVTSPQLSTESSGPYPPFPAVTGTLSVVSLDPNQPVQIVVYGKPSATTTSTSATFQYYVTDAVSDVACSLDQAPLAQCDTSTTRYSGLAPGHHTFVLRATDAAGNTASQTDTWTITSPVGSTAAPRITGSARQGSVLTASPGTWTGYPAPTLRYQWERCNARGGGCSRIARATKSRQRLTTADVGETMRVAVTASNRLGSMVVRSAATARILPRVSAQALRRALARQLKPHGKPATIAALLQRGGYRFRFSALEPGTLTLSWYDLPAGSRLVISHGKVVAQAGRRRRPRPVLVATARLTLRSAGKPVLTIKLTAAGRRLLNGASGVKLTAAGSFAIRGGVPFAVLAPFTLIR